MDYNNETIKNLTDKGKMRFNKGALDEEIRSFENQNNIQLPIGYKKWLLYSDGGELFLPAGIQMYGVSNKPLIDINDADKPNNEYVVIGRTSWGDPIVFKKGEEAISVFNHEANRIEEDESYSDYETFLMDLNNLLGIGG